MYTFVLVILLGVPAFETFQPGLQDTLFEIPEGYTGFSQIHELGEWHGYDIHVRQDRNEVSADSVLPYTMALPADIEFCYGIRNQYFGAVRYGHCSDKSYPNSRIYENPEYGVFYVLWHPHQIDNPSQDTVLNQLIYGGLTISDNLSLEKRGSQEVTVGENQAFRLRGFFYETGGGEGGGRYIGAFTSYLIISDKFDFIIVCFNWIYANYGPIAVLEEAPEHMHDSLIANWEYEHTYPNNIAELEQAVEETFRVKE